MLAAVCAQSADTAALSEREQTLSDEYYSLNGYRAMNQAMNPERETIRIAEVLWQSGEESYLRWPTTFRIVGQQKIQIFQQASLNGATKIRAQI